MKLENKLYFGDNLHIMRDHISDESIDLIYLDPPFNSKATYNVLFDEKNGTHSRAQITAFEDTWHWGIESEEAYHEIVTQGPKKLSDLIQALRSFLGQNDMMAYLTMMAIRLIEMHRVLKPTGSIYLHCDPTASHYLKLVMDAIFEVKNFRNEIVWCYKSGGASKYNFAKKHDIIFRYTKTNKCIFNYEKEKSYGQTGGGQGGKVKYYKDEIGTYSYAGIKDWWTISMLSTTHSERLGYPTQKPETLLERIVKASSNEGDIVFDPFCGCGTTIVVAERLNRKWIGIDITYLAVNLMQHRLKTSFGADLSPYELIGDPKDIQGAKALAEHDRFQFEWWALGKIFARPAQDKKKGADSGVDGYIYFFDDTSGKAKKVIVQVKSGHVSVSQIRDLKGTMKGENAEIGAFITLKEPTRPMIEEAISAGFYEPELLQGKKYPKIQILTIEELFEDRQLKYPRISSEVTFKNAKRKIDSGDQGKLL